MRSDSVQDDKGIRHCESLWSLAILALFGSEATKSKHREQLFRLRVVAECLTHMHKQIFVPRSKDKTSAQLKRIFAQFVLFVATGLGAFAGLHIITAQKMKNVGFLEFQCAIGFAIFIHQQRKSDVCLLAEELGVLKVAQPDRCQGGAFLAKSVFIFAQLRDVLSAENSTIMPQEHDDGGTCTP
jgi:hypothetical protein